MRITRRALLGSAAAGITFGPAFAASSTDGWPARPVRLISPYGAGGSSDISLRILAEYFEGRMGKKFYVENKPGAGSTIANETAARAAPDGYTFLYAAAPYETAEAMFGTLTYDPHKDLRPVALAMLVPLFLIVNAKAPYKTLQEFIAYAKSKPDGITVASPAAGSQPHLAAELFIRTAGIKGVVVQYGGDAPSYIELLAGRVDATTTALPTALPHIKTGALRVLGCFSDERSSAYPEAATLREQGQDIVAAAWYGFMAPAATPGPIVDKMQSEISLALSDTAVKQKLVVQGLDAHYLPGPEFGKFIDNESRKWGKVIHEAGINKQ
ncbi:MAG TPA: tripartite tricarboxylate transporter substrate binding protein [Bradyrhizobium sp.]|nr:tripartite tricarboxylate transporter substrate binding protein [Bradyrhizobium sp.]